MCVLVLTIFKRESELEPEIFIFGVFRIRSGPASDGN